MHPTLIPDLINSCLKHQIFPQTFKEAKVSMILKPNKDPTCTNAYRPISLLKVLAKTLERVICDYLNHEMTPPPITTQTTLPTPHSHHTQNPMQAPQHPTLSPNQYGFRKSMTAEAAINRVLTHLKTLTLTPQYTIAISFDIEAAFDSMLYQGILNNAKHLQLPPYIQNILHSYLHNRIVEYNGTYYSPEKGCPQGSPLSGILFLIPINEVTEIIKPPFHSILFSDDLSVHLRSSNPQRAHRLLQNKINKIHDWLSLRGFRKSGPKTNLVIFQKKS